MSLKALFAGGTVYRNIVWYTKGMKEFTRYCNYNYNSVCYNMNSGGYEKAARSFDDKDLEADITE